MAAFCFARSRTIGIEEETFDFQAGEGVQLFFSYRYTPALVESLLPRFGFKMLDRWITTSEEEGVFLLGR
jgi:hypothetical protein